MDTLEKIDKLNEACDNTLSFSSCRGIWEVHSYRDGSPLNMENKYPYIEKRIFKEVVDEAYEFVFKKKK